MQDQNKAWRFLYLFFISSYNKGEGERYNGKEELEQKSPWYGCTNILLEGKRFELSLVRTKLGN